MSELKAMLLVGAGALVLSAALDVILLSLHASGEMLAACSIGLVGMIASVAMTFVIKHYQALAERRKREEIILSR